MRRGLCVITLLLTALFLTACGNEPLPYNLAHSSILPDFLNDAPVRVREAYRFAIENREILEQYPCYCGCGNLGHRSNLECYIEPDYRNGALVFDEHAKGCGICVDITQDVMRGMREGRSVEDIRAQIDADYGHVAPSTGHLGMGE